MGKYQLHIMERQKLLYLHLKYNFNHNLKFPNYFQMSTHNPNIYTYSPIWATFENFVHLQYFSHGMTDR